MGALLLLPVCSEPDECVFPAFPNPVEAKLGTSNDQRDNKQKPEELSFWQNHDCYLSDDATMTPRWGPDQSDENH